MREIPLARLAAGTLVVPERPPPPVAFAADELRRYLGRLYGVVPAARTSAGAPGAWLALAAGTDVPPPAPLPPGVEWQARAAGEGALLSGAGPRALLAGVYAVLEAAGCRWSPFPGEETVPDPAAARPAVPELTARPAFVRRAWAADLATWHYGVPARLRARLPGDLAFVDWAAKTGGTGLLFIRHANDTQWAIPEVVAALAARGLEVECGGHAIVELLPRELFAAHPEYFPLGGDGRRSDYGNVCASNAEALARIAAAAARARAEVPGGHDLHLWGLDVFGGGWCACAGCAGDTPSDQLLRVCNAAAEALGGGRVYHLAYHDTLRPPAVRPHGGVWAELAPRERCYTHAIDDPACAENAVHRESLARHLERFDGRVDVFEYYADAILFGGCAVPLVEVIARDLAYYARAGVRGVSCLTFGTYSLWAYGANVEAFARGAVRPEAARAARGEHCRRWGAAGAPMARYLAALERAMAAVVTYGDVLLPPRAPERARAVHAALGRVAEAAGRLRTLLAAALEHDSGADVRAQRPLLEYTLATVAGARAWVAGHLAGDADACERAIDALAAAAAHVREAGADVVGTWGVHDLEIVQAFFAAGLRAPAGDERVV